jgi:hypothetical protein
MSHYFTGEDAWFGGFYELAMDFGEVRPEALERALETLWANPGVAGCYLRRDVEPSEQARVAPSLAIQEANGHLQGIAMLPNGKQVACGSLLVRETSGACWVDFYLPLGALSATPEVGGYPLENTATSRQWREPLERWLAEIGQAIFSQVPFRLGLIGYEVSGTAEPEELLGGVPAKRFIGYLCPTGGKVVWDPTNQWHDDTPEPRLEAVPLPNAPKQPRT